MKILAAWGAEWFYTGFFNVHFDSHRQMPDSNQWCWQGMVPAYAQGMLTQYADFLYRGELVMADENTTFAMGGDTGTTVSNPSHGSSPLLWAGKPNILCVVRRMGGAYLITLAVERLSNAELNADVDGTWAATVSLPGDDPTTKLPIKLKARAQGSVYVWRNDTGGSNSSPLPVVYQLDSWHEATHPMYWPTRSMEIEAELFEGHLAAVHLIRTEYHHDDAGINTEGSQGYGQSDSFTTFVDLRTAGDAGTCYTTHTGVSSNAPVAVRVRSRRGWVAIDGLEAAAASDGLEAGSTSSGVWVWHEAVVAIGAQLCLSGTAEVDAISIDMHTP
jgi:hypothetical protein